MLLPPLPLLAPETGSRRPSPTCTRQASLLEHDTLIVLRGAWQPQPPNRRAGNPAGRRSAVPLFVHCVKLAYDDATDSERGAEVAAVVVENAAGSGGTRTIQGSWTDGSAFQHKVDEL